MTLPGALHSSIERALGPIRSAQPVGGGCIHPAYRVDLADLAAFVKYAPRQGDSPFVAEAAGLDLLRAAGTGLRVPRVLMLGGDPDGPDWLALEWLRPARRPSHFGESLGGGLAELHRVGGAAWGWDRDGYIGSLPQVNHPTSTWAEFWWTRRLEPQLRRARDRGTEPGSAAGWDRLAATLPELLAEGEEEGPSLLHGDLWGGNVLSTEPGVPALVDPAVYYGHREVDLAMTELFGGFASDFYAAYDERYPLLPGYSDVRRHVYQLYYLLVHVNLFGGGYVAQTAAALDRASGG